MKMGLSDNVESLRKFDTRQFLIQLSIVVLPPLLAAFIPIPYYDFFERFAGHAGGVTGPITGIALGFLMFESTSIIMLIYPFILVYFLAFPYFICRRIAKTGRVKFYTWLNIIQMVWGLAFGFTWMLNFTFPSH